MRIKKQFYDVNGTFAVTAVFYKQDLDYLDRNYPRLLDIVGSSDNSVNVLHGLIIMAEKIERKNAETRQEIKNHQYAAKVQGLQDTAAESAGGSRPVQTSPGLLAAEQLSETPGKRPDSHSRQTISRVA